MSTPLVQIANSLPDQAPRLSAVAALAATPFSSLDEVIDATLQLMSDLIDVKLSMIHRLEGDTIVVSHMCDRIGLGVTPPITINRTDTFCDVVLANVAPLIVLDADIAPYVDMPGKQIVGTKSYIGVPILLDDQQVFGTLCAHDRRALDLGQQEVDLLLVLARFVASHIERDQALKRQERAAQRLAERNVELAAANQQLRALNQIAESIGATSDLRSLLQTVIASAVDLLDAHGGAISLLGSDPQAPRRFTATHNLPQSIETEAIPARAGLMGQVLAARGPVIVERYNQIDTPLPHTVFHELAPWIAVPLWWDGDIIGTFGLGAADPDRTFNERDIDALTQLAKHASVAIENTRLYAASRELGAAEERNRLAAEIHDTLAQSLFALTFQLQTARGFIPGSPNRAAAELAEAEQRTRAALDEARRSVWNLGPASLEAGTLIEALQGELAASERNGLPCRLVVNGSARPMHAEALLALFRVGQEALVNARKHAGAHLAELTLSYGATDVELVIVDDGRGFDVATVTATRPRRDGGHGLQGMQERVHRIGGQLSISSDPAMGGCRIAAAIPYQPPARSTGRPFPAAAPDAACIRVIVADDHPATRAGLAGILGQQEGITVVATAANGEEALALVQALRPEVLMIDLRMPVLSGVETIARMTKLGLPTRAVAVTTFTQDELVFQAMRAGARGYLLKDAGADELADAVRVVSAGGTLLTPSIAGKLAGGLASNDRLTARERQVLDLLARGYSDKEIAVQLGMSVKTANFHAGNTIAKLGAQNRAEAVRLAYERGLLQE